MDSAGLQMAKDTSTLSPRVSAIGEPNIPPDFVVFGRSAAMEVIRLKIRKVAGTNVPVLIQGESGTGKEVLARLLHIQAPWSDGPFVKVSCPAIPSTLLESELFGYERGAFTGAYGMKPGRIEMANRGTLFLDEIGDLNMGLQAKLLQLLQDGQFSRIGAQEDKRVDVRIVCATNRHLDNEIAAGAFRLDLFYRVNVLDMQLPPLRERREDIPDLVAYFLQTHGAMFKCTPRPISSHLMHALEAYDWPGNIRQLENLVKRYVILGSEEEVARDLAESRRLFSLRTADSRPRSYFPKKDHAAGRGRDRAKSHLENPARPPLEPKTNRPGTEHQLSVVAVQDSGRGPFFPGLICPGENGCRAPGAATI